MPRVETGSILTEGRLAPEVDDELCGLGRLVGVVENGLSDGLVRAARSENNILPNLVIDIFSVS